MFWVIRFFALRELRCLTFCRKRLRRYFGDVVCERHCVRL